MRAEDWIELLKKIPVEDHETLTAATTLGVEIAFQQVLQVNEQFVLVRGRLGGTTDAGRVFCIPWDRLLYLCLTRPMTDMRLAELFGPLLSPPRPDLLAAATQPEAAMLQPEPTPVTPMPVEQATPFKPGAAATLRERLRLRMPGAAPAKPAEPETKQPTPSPAQAPAAAVASSAEADRAAVVGSLRERLRARFGSPSSGSAPGVDKPK